MSFDKLIARFQAADKSVRLETLLDASKRLPPLPTRLEAGRDREAHRVSECQTPVFLWFEREGGSARIYADVPRESPTVRGFVALLIKQLDGQPIEALAAIPNDLLFQLGLDDALGMMRTQGLSAVVRKFRSAGAVLGQA